MTSWRLVGALRCRRPSLVEPGPLNLTRSICGDAGVYRFVTGFGSSIVQANRRAWRATRVFLYNQFSCARHGDCHRSPRRLLVTPDPDGFTAARKLSAVRRGSEQLEHRSGSSAAPRRPKDPTQSASCGLALARSMIPAPTVIVRSPQTTIIVVADFARIDEGGREMIEIEYLWNSSAGRSQPTPQPRCAPFPSEVPRVNLTPYLILHFGGTG